MGSSIKSNASPFLFAYVGASGQQSADDKHCADMQLVYYHVTTNHRQYTNRIEIRY